MLKTVVTTETGIRAVRPDAGGPALPVRVPDPLDLPGESIGSRTP
ncbi:hypothetical protein [Streptomyces sp. NPDC002640]